VTRIELALSAWEADVLPLNYTRERRRRYLNLPGSGPADSLGDMLLSDRDIRAEVEAHRLVLEPWDAELV